MFSSCSTTKVDEKIKKPQKANTVSATKGVSECKTSIEAGKLMITSIIEGLSENNYALYSRDFTKQNKKYFNKKVFTEAADAVKNELGNFKGKEYVGFWKKGNYKIMLWKARYSKTKDDILIEIYITKRKDNTYKIAAVKLI